MHEIVIRWWAGHVCISVLIKYEVEFSCGGIILLTMQDFLYPEDVAYPIGGEGNPHYIILEMHYDNPAEVSGLCKN